MFNVVEILKTKGKNSFKQNSFKQNTIEINNNGVDLIQCELKLDDVFFEKPNEIKNLTEVKYIEKKHTTPDDVHIFKNKNKLIELITKGTYDSMTVKQLDSALKSKLNILENKYKEHKKESEKKKMTI